MPLGNFITTSRSSAPSKADRSTLSMNAIVRWQGGAYLTGFAVPNFFFHVTTTYALLRAQGVAVGKPDFLAHLGQPIQIAAA